MTNLKALALTALTTLTLGAGAAQALPQYAYDDAGMANGVAPVAAAAGKCTANGQTLPCRVTIAGRTVTVQTPQGTANIPNAQVGRYGNGLEIVAPNGYAVYFNR